MKKVSILILLALLASALETNEVVEIVLFLILLILLFMSTVFLTRYIQRYLIRRQIEKDCRGVFTEEFYDRLNKTIKNEFK